MRPATGLIEHTYARSLSRLKDDRENGDYDIYTTFELSDAQNAVREAQRFVDRMGRYLIDNHRFAQKDLTQGE